MDFNSQIVSNRIHHMICIIEDKLNLRKIDFLTKLSLKSNTILLLYSNDNFLQSYSNIDLFRIKNLTSYLKILYSTRMRNSRKFILNAYFLKFTVLIKDFIPIKSESLKKFVMALTQIDLNRDYYKNNIKITLRIWKKITILLRPNLVNSEINQLLFYKNRKNYNLIYFLFFFLKRRKYYSFHRIQHFLTIIDEKSFLDEINQDITSFNKVINIKKNNYSKYRNFKLTSILELESLYLNEFSKLRENLSKEIKCKFTLIICI